MISGELYMKDAVGPTMAFGGGSLTFTPIVIIQIVGAAVGVAGVILTFMRIKEAQRANDIAEQRLQFDKEREEKNAKAENCRSPEA